MLSIIGTLPDPILSLAYLTAGVLFILGLRAMTHPRTATRGNLTSAIGMMLAVGITVLWFEILSPLVLLTAVLLGAGIGTWLAVTTETTDMPQLVGLFNGFGGGASALVAGAELIERYGTPSALLYDVTVTAALAGIIGAVTFSGSLVAAAKLHGIIEDPVRYSGEHVVKLVFLLGSVIIGGYIILQPTVIGSVPPADWVPAYWLLLVTAVILGVLLVIPIGGADMPVVIALLNSLSGLAAATTGFVLDNSVLIIAGTLVGASGMILTTIMCRAMNRSLTNVLIGGFGESPRVPGESTDMYEGNIMSTSPEEVEMLLDTARRVVIVPGYGMAVGQAQHAVAELVDLLEENGVEVEFGIHPVAGRMPGHMNVLLAEANVPYEKMRELEEINPTFSDTDVVLVTGANDVVNPVALTDASSPIGGMPVLHVWDADVVIVNKRSLGHGYAGIPNPLFTNDNTYMLFGDARDSIQAIVNEYKTTH